MSRLVLEWARRWLAPDDVTHVIEPAIADWRHEGRGFGSVLKTIVVLLIGERWALAKQAPWWLLAFPILAAVLGTVTMTDGSAALQAAWIGAGALAFGLVVTTPTRWLTSTWAWVGVAGLALTLVVGTSQFGATRWLGLGPLNVLMTMLMLPLVASAGWRPAAIGAALLAVAPDALSASALALAHPHPATALAAIVALIREPAMIEHLGASPIAIVAAAMMTIIAARWWRLAEGRLVLALMVFGAVAFAFGHGPMPLASYGGSPIVAVCLGFAFAIRRSGGWTPLAEVG